FVMRPAAPVMPASLDGSERAAARPMVVAHELVFWEAMLLNWSARPVALAMDEASVCAPSWAAKTSRETVSAAMAGLALAPMLLNVSTPAAALSRALRSPRAAAAAIAPPQSVARVLRAARA